MHLNQGPLVSIIVLNYNRKDLLKKCLASICMTDYPNFEVIVVDNGSTDGSCTMITSTFPSVRLVKSKVNLGYSRGNNLGIASSNGSFLVLLNNDTIVSPPWLSELIHEAKRNPQCFYQPKILFENTKRINSAGNYIQLFGFAFPSGIGENADLQQYSERREVSYASGACVLVSRNLVNKVGLLDEDDLFTFYEDVNWGWRGLMIGCKSVYVPSSIIYHRWGGSWGSKLSPRKFYLLERGRLASAIRNYAHSTLVIMLPSLVIAEIMVLIYSLSTGFISEKIGVYSDIIKYRKLLRGQRKLLQSKRSKPDRYIVASFCNGLSHIYLKNNSRLLNSFLLFFSRLVRRHI